MLYQLNASYLQQLPTFLSSYFRLKFVLLWLFDQGSVDATILDFVSQG